MALGQLPNSFPPVAAGIIRYDGANFLYDNFDYLSAVAPATTGAMTVNMTSAVITITPTGACTFNGSGGVTGQIATFVITTSGTSSFILTFGTNLKTISTLATGIITGKKFCISFRCIDGTNWVEISRTAAI